MSEPLPSDEPLAAVVRALEPAGVVPERFFVVATEDGWTVKAWTRAGPGPAPGTTDPDYVFSVVRDGDGRIDARRLHP